MCVCVRASEHVHIYSYCHFVVWRDNYAIKLNLWETVRLPAWQQLNPGVCAYVQQSAKVSRVLGEILKYGDTDETFK